MMAYPSDLCALKPTVISTCIDTRGSRDVHSDNEVLDAAAIEFAQHAYAATSLSSIAGHLNLTKGALVRRFPTKATFAQRILDVTRQAIIDERDISLEAYPASGIRTIVRFFLGVGARVTTEPQVAAGLVLLSDRASPVFASRELFNDWIDSLVILLKRAQDLGEINESEDIRDLAEYLFFANMGDGVFGGQLRSTNPAAPRMRMMRRALTHGVSPNAGEIIDELIASRADGTLAMIPRRSGREPQAS